MEMADGCSALCGRRAARSALLSLFLQVLCTTHLHVCSADAVRREAATAAALDSSLIPVATASAARVVIRHSSSITRRCEPDTGPEETLEAARTSALTLATATPFVHTAPAGDAADGRAARSAGATDTAENEPTGGSVSLKQELESAAKEPDKLLETNEVGVGNTAGRYFEDIRPTRTASGGGAGSAEVLVASTATSGEEEGASPNGRVGPQASTKRGIATPTDIAREYTAQDEEQALVKKIWDIAEGANMETTSKRQTVEGVLPHARALGDNRPWNPNVEAKAATEIGTTPAAGPDQVSSRSEERKTNPDIQDIITGIVKLLNGNVKVQASTNVAGSTLGGAVRPARPMTTRINNRGPPRITDLPPLPPLDFEASPDLMPPPPPPPPPPAGPSGAVTMTPERPLSSASTHLPPPYPFNRPHLAMTALPPQPNLPPNAHPFVNGVPLPEQMVPVAGGRPSSHPRPPQRLRPGSNRRPTPSASLLPQLPVRPLPEDVPVIPVTYHAFELLPSTGTGDGGEGGDVDDVILPDAVAEAEGSSAFADEGTGQEEDSPVTAQPLPPQPKPEKDFKKPMELNKEKDSPAKTSLGVASTTPSEMPSPIPTVLAMDITSASANITSNSKEKQSTSDSVTKIVTTTTTTTTSTTTTAEEPPLKPQEPNSPDTPPPSTTSERPILLEPSLGIGVAVPVLESSMQEAVAASSPSESASRSEWPESLLPVAVPTAVLPSSAFYQPAPKPDSGYSYRPRPGLVLDDPEYKPVGTGMRPLGVGQATGLGAPPVIVTAPVGSRPGEVFDVTVSAVQGPGGSKGPGPAVHTGRPFVYPVEVESDEDGAQLVSGEVITSPQNGQHFVSIDGKRTYINLMGQPTSGPAQPSRPVASGAGATTNTRPANPPPPHQQANSPGIGLASATPAGVVGVPSLSGPGVGAARPSFGGRRPPPPAQPPVRIDTCIVGDASTCDEVQHERCHTEHGVSACHCRPGYSRRKHREPCKRIVSMLMSLRVDRLYERRVVWSRDLQDPSSELYQQMQWEASRAVDSAMSMTPFSDDFLGARVNGMYAVPGTPAPVFVNFTLQLEETTETLRPAVRHDVQRHLLGVIHRRANNVGESALWVDAPAGAVSHLEDVDECARPDLHDCHPRAQCSNVFGGFRCACEPGLQDPWADQPQRAGRACKSCPTEHCGGRGACHYDAQGQPVCTCSGNFYGAQCEVDGEVLGVAVGASVAAVVIIVLTLICLCMWSRRWNREQKAAVGSPVFGYLGATGGTVKTPAVGSPPYQVSLEDRLRWAQIADVMAQANHYASPLTCHQPEPSGTMPTRPSSAVFGYPALSSGLTGTLPPAPLPRLGLHGLLPLAPPPAPSTRAGNGARTLENSSSGDDEDRTDLLGRSFHVPRPKSRSSVANQSGIYYDVDYDQSDIYGTKRASIPLNTYARRGSYHRQ